MALTDDLVAYWPLDAASGDEPDAHQSHDLIEFNGVASAAGKVGTARLFAAAGSDYFRVADHPDLSTGDVDFTVQVGVKLTSKTTAVLACKDDTAGAGTREWQLYYYAADDKFHFVVWNFAGAAVADVAMAAPASLSTGVWYLVHAWHDAANNLVGISVDAGAANTAPTGGVGPTNSTAAFYLGRLGGGTPAYLDGALDEVGFWKGRVLSSGERTQLYNGGSWLAYPFAGGGGGGSKVPAIMHNYRRRRVA